MLLLHLDRFSLWLIWLMMTFPVVPIRKFLAGKIDKLTSDSLLIPLSSPFIDSPLTPPSPFSESAPDPILQSLLSLATVGLLLPNPRSPQKPSCPCCSLLQGHILPIFQGENFIKGISRKRSPGFFLQPQVTAS